VVVAEKPWGTHYRVKAYPVDGRQEFQFISDLTVRRKAALAPMVAEG
jgi:small conductance mechanosensitive channel